MHSYLTLVYIYIYIYNGDEDVDTDLGLVMKEVWFVGGIQSEVEECPT